jgi:hypothetical protein
MSKEENLLKDKLDVLITYVNHEVKKSEELYGVLLDNRDLLKRPEFVFILIAGLRNDEEFINKNTNLYRLVHDIATSVDIPATDFLDETVNFGLARRITKLGEKLQIAPMTPEEFSKKWLK